MPIDKQVVNKERVFFTPERQQRLDLILHLIPNTQQAILLRGPEQSGKSFFIQQFKEQANSAWRICTVLAENLKGSTAPLEVCADAFDELEANQKQILVRLESWSKNNQKIILCVEDAHQLDVARFDFLFQLTESYECLHLLLTSSDNLGEEVEARCQLIDIEPFSQKQTSDYAKLRIHKNGLDFVNLAGLDEVVLFIETGGLPGRINDVLDQMVNAPARDVKAVKPERGLPLLWILGVAVVLTAAVTVNMLSGPEEMLANDGVESDVESSVKPVKMAEAPTEKRRDTRPVLPKEKKTVPKVVEKPVLPTKIEKALSTVPVSVETVKVVEPIKKVESVKQLLVIQKKTVTLDKEASVKSTPKNKVAKSPLTALQKTHARLKQINAKRYTLQLIGVSTEQSAQKYIASHSDVSTLTFFQNKRNDGRWYSVIYGDFSDKGAALKATKTLPSSLGKLKPWVRRFEAIQADLYSK